MIHIKKRSLFFVLSFVFLLSLAEMAPAASESRPDVTCDIHHGPCSRPLSGGEGKVTLDIQPRPVKAMTDLKFTVHLCDIVEDEPPYIDLSMPGMKMGPNRIGLQMDSSGSYTGGGVIVRCPSGKTLWQATVTVPGFGTSEFVFDVVY